MTIKQQLLAIIFIAEIIGSVIGIKCYVCSISGCSDPFNANNGVAYTYDYGSSYIACAKIVSYSDKSSITRGGLTFYYGSTWEGTGGNVYACQTDLCNGAYHVSSFSQMLLIACSMLGGILVKQQLV